MINVLQSLTHTGYLNYAKVPQTGFCTKSNFYNLGYPTICSNYYDCSVVGASASGLINLASILGWVTCKTAKEGVVASLLGFQHWEEVQWLVSPYQFNGLGGSTYLAGGHVASVTQPQIRAVEIRCATRISSVVQYNVKHQALAQLLCCLVLTHVNKFSSNRKFFF